MDYIGEHRLPGQFGHFFIVLSLIASLVATFSYFKSAQSKNDIDGGYWKKLARYAFITECISVFSIFAILFYIISNHLFEYKYAWQHSSKSLEVKYLLACFWEGQEGSFLLWSLWHCVLGLILIKTTKKWESSVMTVVSFAQFCLATMLAGLYVFGHKIGSNPFILLRESEVFSNAPGMHIDFDINNPVRPDYMSLKQMQDGNDLNPLLQNKWMVIHPPVLFLGFASTIVPFAFAIAGLWKKQFTEWIKPALPWALFSSAVFGVGIMMGAWWAYESLTFGGYWAWDPVENASLVPWLILIAGIHTLLIYKHSGHSLRSAFLFIILSFFFVLYSTFLTRSGILGETSVHAFTDLGMNGQLYLLLYAFIWLPSVFSSITDKEKLVTGITAVVLLLMSAYINVPAIALLSLIVGVGILIYQIQKQVPTITKEESSSSREFWMFIGSLVIFITALVIIGKTSLPVFNKVFNTSIAPPEDQEYAYNQIQIFVAIILGLLTAVGQYLRYKNTPAKVLWKGIGIPTIISAVVAALVLQFGDINYNKQTGGFLIAIWVAVAAAVYAIIANAAYIWVGLKGKLKLSGGSISHLGFGMVLLGILLSSSKKEILSYNRGGIPIDFGADAKETGENLTLIKGLPMKMGKYDVTYVSDSMHPKKEQWYYTIHFKSRTDDEEFTLKPNAFVNYKGNEGLMANPDSKHYWDHDVFTYISALPNPDKTRDTSSFQTKTLKPGDSVFYSQGYMVLEEVKARDNLPVELFGTDGSLHEAPIRIFSKSGSIFSLTPTLANAKGNLLAIPDTVASEGLILRLEKVNPDNTIELGFKESDSVLQYVALKAYKFPFINLLWFGVILTAIGIFISMARRISLNRLSANR
jgi:cytochrome c-type biogenesis protein CcmF